MATAKRREPQPLDRLRVRTLDEWGSTEAWRKAVHAYADEHGVDYRDVLAQLGEAPAEWQRAESDAITARRAARVGVTVEHLRRSA